MAKRRRLVDRYLPDVQAAVNVKYGPEMNALRDLLSTAQSTRDQTIAGAEAGRQGILNAMRGIAPMVQQAYHSAGLDPSPAINALGSYGSQAAQGAIVQRRQALEQYRGDVGKIQGRQAQLQSEAGDFAVSELNRLLEGARGRSVTRAGQRATAANQAADRALRQQSQAETQRHNVAMENRPTRGSGGGGKGKSPYASPATQAKILENVKNASAAARRLMTPSARVPRPNSSEVRALLASGKVDGRKYDHDVINAAFDLLPTSLGGRGGLSHPNVAALHGMGLQIRGRLPIIRPPRARRNSPNFVGPVPRS